MRRPVLFWSVAVLLPILHFLLHVGFGLGPFVPDLLTLGLLIMAREVRSGTAAGIGFGLGLMEDAFSILSFGANALALTIIGAVGSRSRELFVGESLTFLVSYLAVGTWMRFAIHWLASGPGLRPDMGEALAIQAPLVALYTAGIGIAVLRITGIWSGERGR